MQLGFPNIQASSWKFKQTPKLSDERVQEVLCIHVIQENQINGPVVARVKCILEENTTKSLRVHVANHCTGVDLAKTG